MAMNTPIGNITQITPITSFTTLGSVALDQYILGINNFVQGDGSKVTLQNLIASMVNTTNEKNILGLDENGKLQAIEAVNPFGQDNGWAIAPTLTVNWTNRTVSGTGGHAYKDGFEITALQSFTSPAWSADLVGVRYLYYDITTNTFVWSATKPDSNYLIARIDIRSAAEPNPKMAEVAYGMGGVNPTIRDFLNKALGTIVLDGGNIGNVTEDQEITVGNYTQPTISATTIGTSDFAYTIPALTAGSYTRVHVANNQMIYDTAQQDIVATHSNGVPIIISNAGVETEIALGCCANVWLVGLPLFGENPTNAMHYQFATGSVQYESAEAAKGSSPTAEITMQYIAETYDRYAIIARFTVQRTENGYMIADYDNYNPLTGGGGAGSVGITEVISDSDYFAGSGIPSSPLTVSEDVKMKLDEVAKDLNNVYKVLDGHKSHDGRIWDLIEYHDPTDKDTLILGDDSRFTTNTSDNNFHFNLLNSIAGSNNPDSTAQLNIYKLFNKSHFDAQSDPIYVQDGTIVISCRKKMRISKIEIRAYDTYYVVPQIHICGLNLDEPLVRDITLSDFANARYLGGQSITKEVDYNVPTADRWGLNRPIYLNMNQKDYYNIFFICFDNWCSGESGSNRRYAGIKIWGTQEETEDGDLTPKSDKLLQVLGDYDVKMSGKGLNKNAFTVVGNPTITRNGILNQATSSNHVTTNALTLSNNNDIDIEMQVYLLGHHCYIFGGNYGTRFEPLNSPHDSYPAFSVLSFAEQFALAVTEVLPENEWITIRLHYRGANSYAEILENGSFRNLSSIILLNGSFSINEPLKIGTFSGLSSNCNIALKQFSITVDGETVFSGGIEYEDCKWVAANGNVYNSADLIEQYGEIPQERVELDRWVSCFGHRFGYSATTKAVDNYYPCLVDGTISTVGSYTYVGFGACRQSDYMPNPRVGVGYITTANGYIQTANTLGSTHTWQYEATDTFPAGEYFLELISGYNNALIGNLQAPDQYALNKFKVECLDADDNVVYKQAFACEGSMYDKTPMYRTPRFYIPEGFKKVRIITLDSTFPDTAQVISQIQMYKRDNEDVTGKSFVISPTEFDLKCNMVRHVTNKHFFITPTGIRVGSNCFVDQVDPTIQQACVGNRWINENTRKSYVCNTSGVWEEEDFCELACMVLWGSEHKGMLKRTVFNEENPMERYVQEYGNLGGQLAFDDDLKPNVYTVIETDPDAPDFYFVAESKAENEGVKIFYPANHLCISSYYRQLSKSRIYESGEQYAHWSNNDNVGARMIAYKTFETEAAGEYIESEDIE